MFRIFTNKLGLSLIAITLFLSSCVKNPPITSDEVKTFDNSVALKWNNLYLDVERNAAGRVRPPQSGRILAYIGIAEYEALVQGMPEYNSIASRYPELTIPNITDGQVYHWPTVYNTIYATMLKQFYPTDPIKVIDAASLYKIYALETEIKGKYKNEGIPTEVLNRSEDYGTRVANAVFAWSATDSYGHEYYNKITDPSYVPPTGAGKWQPTSSGAAMGPYWGKCRLMASPEIYRTNGVLPIPFSEDPNSKFYQQAKEVQVTVNDIKAGKDDDGRWISEFWSDDMAGFTFTPAGRMLAILNQLVAREQLSLDKSIEAYAKLGMALNDAGVVCWALKYKWNVERPESYIQRVMDKNWKPIMGEPTAGKGNGFTPPFPAYPSGHSTFGASGSEVMASIFGYNIDFVDRCHEGRTDFVGTPRAFKNFYDLAVEDAYSRIPIGVHFRMDCEEGLRIGFLVGQKVNNLPWKK